MKSLPMYLTESWGNSIPSTLYFTSPSSAAIYLYEVEGQISDGIWENSRPYDHWQWVTKAKCVIDPNCEPHYECDWNNHQRKYSLNEIKRAVKNTLDGVSDEYDFFIRAFKVARFASLFDKSDYDIVLNEKIFSTVEFALDFMPYEYQSNLRDYVEYFDKSINSKIPYTEDDMALLEIIYNSIIDTIKNGYQKKYINDLLKVFTFDKFVEYLKSRYGYKDFQKDINDCQKTINTYVRP